MPAVSMPSDSTRTLFSRRGTPATRADAAVSAEYFMQISVNSARWSKTSVRGPGKYAGVSTRRWGKSLNEKLRQNSFL